MFLKKLYKQWRSMFWIAMIFIIGQMFFMFKGIENIPFFLYHMFSTKHAVHSGYWVLTIKTDKGFFDRKNLSNREYELLIGSAEYYASLKAGGDPTSKTIESRFGRMGNNMLNYANKHLVNDSLAIANYPTWWARYFSEVTGSRFKVAGLVWIFIHYADAHTKVTVGDILFSVKLAQ